MTKTAKALIVQTWIALVICSIVIPHSACAYIDMTTGSYAAQLTFMAFAGLAIMVKTWWRSVLQVLTSKLRNKHV